MHVNAANIPQLEPGSPGLPFENPMVNIFIHMLRLRLLCCGFSSGVV